MSDNTKLSLLKEMLENAEAHIKTARQILNELSPDENGTPSKGKSLKSKYSKIASTLPESGIPSDGEKIVEGVFDGQNMIGKDHQLYPVPANYASKSKLVAGDALKLIIGRDGSFIYKQIGPVERKRVTGTLIQEEGQYKILADGNIYKVLLASVTYFHAEIGDKVTILVPEAGDSEWATIENILPTNAAIENPEELKMW